MMRREYRELEDRVEEECFLKPKVRRAFDKRELDYHGSSEPRKNLQYSTFSGVSKKRHSTVCFTSSQLKIKAAGINNAKYRYVL